MTQAVISLVPFGLNGEFRLRMMKGGREFYLHNYQGVAATYADDMDKVYQRAHDRGAGPLLYGEYWRETKPVYQGGSGVARLAGASA